jgi:methyl-accepting chemotaxis protein
MLDNISIGKKLALGFGLVLVLMGCVAATGWYYSRSMTKQFDSLYTENLQSSLHLAKAERGMWELRFGIANYIAGNPEMRAKVHADEGKWFKQVDDSLQAYRSGARTEAELQGLNEFDLWYAQYRNARSPWFALIDAGKMEEAAAFRAANTNRFAQASVKALGNLIELQNQLGEAKQNQAQMRYYQYGFAIGGVILVSGLLALFIFSRLHRMITTPLRGLIDAARNIGDSGDLEQEITIESSDEIGELADSFRKMIAYLKETASTLEGIAGGDLSVEVEPRSQRDTLGNASNRMTEGLSRLVSRVRDGSQQVASGANQVASASEDSAKVSLQAAAAIDEVVGTMHEMSVNVQNVVRSTQMQASSVSQTAASIQEMMATNERVASTAKVLLDISNRSRQEVQNGTTSMDKATEGLSRINTSILSSAEIIAVLGQRTHDIGKIIEVIDDLAEQTNLLALNAAIEAARAGEHGLGFAVVADEVRKLAEKSAQSTQEISALIESIQKETRRAVENMDKSTAFVNDGLALGHEVGRALQQISNVVSEVFRFAQEIGTATQEQSLGSSQIAKATARLDEITHEINCSVQEQASGTQAVVKAMERMGGLTTQVTSGSTELAASAEQMSKMARDLMQYIDRFKLNADDSPKLPGARNPLLKGRHGKALAASAGRER